MTNKKEESTKYFDKWAVGLCVVRSINGNFNADISRMPRRLPDKNGTIYATDKALKYCIRNYLVNKKYDKGNEEKVFMWRRQNEKLEPLNIDENYEETFKVKAKDNRKEVRKNLLSCIDVRLFGCTYAGDENIAIHGTTQISYGINGLQDNIVYTNQILSPFQNRKKGDAEQSSMGDESKSLDVCYVYDYNINPNNLNSGEGQKLTTNDVELFKEALCRGVNYVNTTTKIGSEMLMAAYIELNKPKMLQNLKKLVEITKNSDGKLDINITNLAEYLDKFSKDIENVQIFSEKEKITITNASKEKKITINELDLLAEKA